MKYKILTITISISVLSGCFSTKIVNPDNYKSMNMERASVFPTAVQLENRPYKVVVFDINDKGLTLARDAKAGTTVTRELKSQIGQTNAILLGKSGMEELKKAIDTQRTDYTNTTEVDYALTGRISVAKYTKEYVAAKRTKAKDGTVHVSDPYCNHGTLLQGKINIYNARTLRLAHSFAISAGSHKNEKLERDQSLLCRDLTKKVINNYLWSNGASAVGREDVQLRNFFRPKGYVLEKRIKDNENIFRISIGNSSGVIEDQDAVFYTIKEDKDPVSGKIFQVQNKLGEGTVSNQVHEKHSWVYIKDKDVASQIKRGDIVKVVYKKSFMDKIFNHSYSD